MLCHTILAADINHAALKDLSSEDFATRNAALDKLSKAKLSYDALLKLSAEQTSPETKHRLRILATEALIGRDFVALEHADFSKITAAGKEAEGSSLYLIKVLHKGQLYIGKFNKKAQMGHFPFKDSEIIASPKQTHIFQGKGVWLTKKLAKSPHVMAVTADGKKVYAAKSNISGGIHIGQWTEGDATCRISYGGKVSKLTDFEILCIPAKK